MSNRTGIFFEVSASESNLKINILHDTEEVSKNVSKDIISFVFN